MTPAISRGQEDRQEGRMRPTSPTPCSLSQTIHMIIPSFPVAAPHDELGNHLESLLVLLIKRPELDRVKVEDTDGATIREDERDHNLRLCLAVAGCSECYVTFCWFVSEPLPVNLDMRAGDPPMCPGYASTSGTMSVSLWTYAPAQTPLAGLVRIS